MMGYPKLDERTIKQFVDGEIVLSVHKRYISEYRKWLDNIGVKTYYTKNKYKLFAPYEYKYVHIWTTPIKYKFLSREDAKIVRKANKKYEMKELIKKKKEIEQQLQELENDL